MNDVEFFQGTNQSSPFNGLVTSPQRDQMDPTYLAALIELGNVKGVPLVYACSKFVAAVFGKELNDVISDAIDQLAPRGVSFGA